MARKARALQKVDKRKDIVPNIRDWWRIEDETVFLNKFELPQCIRDIAMLSTRHVAMRLTDPETPPEIKDRLASLLAPKMMTELRGTLSQGSGQGREVQDLMGVYKITNR